MPLSGLPTGLVTFLFSDVEGSTRLAQRLGSGFSRVIDDHNQILRSAITSRNGRVIGTEGDSFFAVFTGSNDGVAAALEAQRRLRRHPWPPGGTVSVRMGLHTGEGRLGGENYAGVDVIAASRIADAAHGGQILVSAATRSALSSGRGPGVDVRDLGMHRLKGLDSPMQLYQVVHDDLLSEFPPLRSQGPPTNLPADDSVFVGREQELAEVDDLLRRHRLVTLAGTGGTGKTRLAVRVARGAIRRFDGGVYLVRLDTIDDPGRVAAAVAVAIGASQIDEPFDAIVERVGERPMLVVLDNFETVVEAGPVVSRLIESCPALHVLVTSQRLLHVRMETVYPVGPLDTPVTDDVDSLSASDSVALFIERATSADRSFELTDENAADIASIVRRLDGIPLAIELAAARLRVLGLASLRSELEHRVSVLAGGFADAPERHRSLEEAVSWSYALLDPGSQAVFRRAAVFSGGFTLRGAESVCAAPPVTDVSAAMTELVDNSLVVSRLGVGEPRFRMLEPLRLFGLDRLDEAGERADTARSHAEVFARLAIDASGSLHGPGHHAALAPFGEEGPNLATALEWCAANNPDLGLSALLVVAYNAVLTGTLADGRRLAEQLLAAGGSPRPRLTGLLGAAAMSYWMNDYASASVSYREAVRLAGELGQAEQLAEALYGDAFSLVWLGQVDRAERRARSALELFEELGDERGIGGLAILRAFATWIRGDLPKAASLFADIVGAGRENDDVGAELLYALALSGILMRLGSHRVAAAIQLDALDRFAELHDEGGMVHAIDWLAIAATTLDPRGGLPLAGAIDALRSRRGGLIDLQKLGLADPRGIAAERLSPHEVERHWAEGRHLDLEATVALARTWARDNGIAAAPIDTAAILENL